MNASSEAVRPCIVCSDTTMVRPSWRFGELRYVECGRCELVYVNRLATDTDMRSAYTGGWVRDLRRRLMNRYRKVHQHKHFRESMARARKIYQFAASQRGLVAEAPRVLDIGCNKGYLLVAAIEDNADVYGIELVPEIMRPFTNTYPPLADHIFSEKLSVVAPRLASEFFDVITAIDVVEHFEDPAADMRQIHRILKDDGVFVVQTPDAGCDQAKRSGGAWGALKPLEHLQLFNRANFARFARAIGFGSVEFCEPFEQADGNFVAVLRKD